MEVRLRGVGLYVEYRLPNPTLKNISTFIGPSLILALKMELTGGAKMTGESCNIYVGIPLGPGALLISSFINCFSTFSTEIMYLSGIWSDLSGNLDLSHLGISALTLGKNSLMRLAN